MTLNITKNLAAENYLVDIWVYSFENWGVVQADRYLEQLDDGFRFLAANPNAGINCDDLRIGYFQFPIKKHAVFYKVENKILRIIRVLGDELDHAKYL